MRPPILFLPDAIERLSAELDNLGVGAVNASQEEQAREVDLIVFDPKRLGEDVAALRRRFEDTHPGVSVLYDTDTGFHGISFVTRDEAAVPAE